jgi:plastocyanin
MQLRRTVTIFALAIVAAVLLASCGGDDNPPAGSGTDTTQDQGTDTGTTGDAGGGTADLEFTITGFAFPTGLKVPAGGTVAVTNGADVSHTVTADDGDFDTDSISSGDTVTFTAPDKAGDYPFHCAIHSQMKGLLTVE